MQFVNHIFTHSACVVNILLVYLVNLQSTYFKDTKFRVNKMEGNLSFYPAIDVDYRCRLLARRETPSLFFHKYKLYDCKIYRASSIAEDTYKL